MANSTNSLKRVPSRIAESWNRESFQPVQGRDRGGIMNQTLLSVVFVCASVPAVGQEDLKTGIEQEIHRLGSDRPEEREKAVQDLKGRGKSVLPALKKALAEAKDPEVTVRLNRLIRNLEPLALEAIEEYLSNAKVEIIVVNAWKDPFVRKTLPEVSFFQL